MSGFGLGLVLFAALLALVGLIRFLAWLTDLQEAHGSLPRAGVHAIRRYVVAKPVKHFEDTAPVVMSRSEDVAFLDYPSSLQTDSGQTADRPSAPAFSRDVMLDTYRLLRRHGVTREEARPILKALGMGLDNNLWASAVPSDEPHVTPIVGRPTSARFDVTDPDYPYRAPA